MGVSYSMAVVIGVEVPLDWVFTQVTHIPEWCHHSKNQDAQFCPSCGLERPQPRKTKEISKEMVAQVAKLGPDLDVYDFLYGGNLSQLLPDGLGLWFFYDNLRNRVMLAGLSLAEFEDPKWGGVPAYQASGLPAIPTEQEIASALEAVGIPYVV